MTGNEQDLLPNLFRSEYQKIVAVLVRRFGITHLEIAEDIVSDTFLTATESWSHNGVPDNPTAWLYTVAKNKTKNYFKHNSLFEQKLVPELRSNSSVIEEEEIDLSNKNISDSQLAMMFAVCNPVVPSEVQIALALNLLCGFGAQEIADAFLTNKEVVYKRINRGKEKLKEFNVKVAQPSIDDINERLDTVFDNHLPVVFRGILFHIAEQQSQERFLPGGYAIELLADPKRSHQQSKSKRTDGVDVLSCVAI